MHYGITPMLQTSRRQYRNNCGASACYMMLDLMRKANPLVDLPPHPLESPEIALNALKTELNGNEKNGQTHVRDIARVLRLRGVPCRVASGVAVRSGAVVPPAILLVRYGDWSGNASRYRDGHYVLWVGVDGESAIVYDPLQGERAIPDGQFGRSVQFAIAPIAQVPAVAR